MKEILKAAGVSKSFGGVKALDNCSIAVKEGTITAIIGPNGAGKTTLFNVISGTLKPDGGSIIYKGEDVTKDAVHKIARRGISRTFQMTRLFKNMSIKDNFLVANAHASKDDMHIALQKVFLKKDLNEKAGSLSYGQQKLLEIARAMIMPHNILMLDEPTAGVNPLIRRELAEILKSAKREGRTVVLIEHDMDFVMAISDEVIVLNEGSVLAKGTPSKIRNDKKVLEAYLGG